VEFLEQSAMRRGVLPGYPVAALGTYGRGGFPEIVPAVRTKKVHVLELKPLWI